MKIIVNAIPLLNVRTGIGRYVYSLYKEIELRSDVDVAYFDGVRVCDKMPAPSPLPVWSFLTKIFWALPPRLGLIIRIALQRKRQKVFERVAHGFDIYHEPSFFPFTPPPEIKTVVTVHDLSLMRHPLWHPRERVLHFEHYFEKMLPVADHFIAVSEFTKREMCELLDVNREMVTSIPLGVDAKIFYPPTSQEVERVLAKYELPKEFFLFVGSGDPRKNVEIVPEALKKTGLDIPLVLAGWSGWDAERAPYDNTIALGYVPDTDLPGLYGGATATVYPSLYEGFGLPICEAMACGCPVVTTRLASLPEVGGNEVVYLDSPHDSDELAMILTRLATNGNVMSETVENGRIRVASRTWKKVADSTINIFQMLLQGV